MTTEPVQVASGPAGDLVGKLVSGWSRDENRRDFDMDDGPDLPALTSMGRLGEALEFVQAVVWPAFDRADKAAIGHQNRHRRLTEVAAVCGSLAVLFGIVQLVFPSLVGWHWLGGMEVVVAVVALLAVILGVKAAFQFNWLLERHRAERLRELKFGLLVHEDLWCGRFDEWKAHARQRVLDLSGLTRADVEAWADRDRVSLPEKKTAGCSMDAGLLRALAGFYIAKRLGYQMSYFERRSRKHGGQDRWLRHWPAWCFYGSVAAVFVHYMLDALCVRSESQELLAKVLILLAVALPVVGACVRTIRVARELGRSASLFRAKHSALENLLRRLMGELEAVPVRTMDALRSIAACEDFLEAEQREWLRLMREAEWFG